MNSTRAATEFGAGLRGILQQGIPVLGDDLPIELLATTQMRGTPKFPGVFGIAQQRAHGIGEAFNILRIDQRAGVAQYFRNPASVRPYDWSRAGHGFGIHETKWLLEN
jgi:hypothetical protein